MALTPSEKVKRYRARQREGLVVLPVAVDLNMIVGLLLDDGFLRLQDDLCDRNVVRAGLERAIATWGWRADVRRRR
jgi:hypothetical protein